MTDPATLAGDSAQPAMATTSTILTQWSETAVSGATLHQHGRRRPGLQLERIAFSEVGLRLPEIVEIPWQQVALADIQVRDHGRRVELALCAGNHSRFDFLRLVMPLDPSSAALLQLAQRQVPRLESVAGVLLKWPLAGLYGPTLPFTQVLFYYNILAGLFEVLFGIMFFTTLTRTLNSSGNSIFTSLSLLKEDLSRLLFAEHDRLPAPISALLRFLTPILGQTIISHIVAPFLLSFGIGWVLIDFHSDLLTLALLAPHVLMLAFSVNRLCSTIGLAVKLVVKAARFLCALLTKRKQKAS